MFFNISAVAAKNVSVPIEVDKNEKTIILRYETYLEKTLPILDHYKEQNLLHHINGMLKIDQIFDEIRVIIASLET